MDPTLTNAPAGAPVPGATNTAADSLRDIVGPVKIVPLSEWLLLAAGLILLLALLALAFVLYRRAQRRRAARGAAPIPALPAHLRARRLLEQALRLLGDPDPFCTEVSRILRLYLEERFGWNAPDRTTEEFLSELGGRAELSAEDRELLGAFLTRCDLVKFARHDPTEGELLELHRAALRLVDDTVPPPPPAPDHAGHPPTPASVAP